MSVFTNPLSQRFLTLTPDLRGYGQSQVEVNFEMKEHLSDLEKLLDRFQVQKCLVLGWSLGGILAMELALQLPERVTGLILIATAARPRSSHPPIRWEDYAYTGLASILNRVYPGWDWNIERFGKRSLYRYLLQQHTAQAYHYLAVEGMSAYLQTSKAANLALTQAIQAGYNRLADLAQIQCPSLVLAGEGDRHITLESSRETAQHLPHSQWRCYAHTAHLFPWEIPQQVIQDIEGWIASHPEVLQPDGDSTCRTG